MASRTTHTERTAAEPREAGSHIVTLDKIKQVVRNVRLFELRPRLARGETPFKARHSTQRENLPLMA